MSIRDLWRSRPDKNLEIMGVQNAYVTSFRYNDGDNQKILITRDRVCDINWSADTIYRAIPRSFSSCESESLVS